MGQNKGDGDVAGDAYLGICCTLKGTIPSVVVPNAKKVVKGGFGGVGCGASRWNTIFTSPSATLHPEPNGTVFVDAAPIATDVWTPAFVIIRAPIGVAGGSLIPEKTNAVYVPAGTSMLKVNPSAGF